MTLTVAKERDGSMGYIEDQDVRALRRVAKPQIRVVWRRDGSVAIYSPSGQKAILSFNQHIYEAIEQILSGEFR